MVHVFTAHETHVLAVQETGFFLVEFDYEETAFGVADVHENHHSSAVLEVGYSVISVVWRQTEPIVDEDHFFGMEDNLSASFDEFSLVVWKIRRDSEVVTNRIEIVAWNNLEYFTH